MNKRLAAAGLAIACVLLAGCGESEGQPSENILQLPECSGKNAIFAGKNASAARSIYHSTVAGVVAAHVSELSDLTARPLQCTANDYRELLRPSAALSALANQLPEWGPSRAGDLSEADLGPVLLEYLRVYECSLHERERFVGIITQDEKGETTTDDDGNAVTTIDSFTLSDESEKEKHVILEEYLTARPALERTLAFVGEIDRLRPLSAELECLKRASLDLRNVTGLMAESASCMPKILDARGSLRDLVDEQQ